MKNNRRGASVLSIGIAVVIMIIILSTITFNVANKFSIQKLDNLYNDIRILKEKVEIYYFQYGKLPIAEEFTDIRSIPAELLNINDGEKYYKININALSNITINTEISEDSFFVINEQSHTIYYPMGIKVEGVEYYKLPEEYTKIYTQEELDQMAKEEAERIFKASLITQWDIPEDNTQIQLPVRGNMNITVDWGDGSIPENFAQKLTKIADFPVHTYARAGNYDVKIIGECEYFGFFEQEAIAHIIAPTTTNSSKDYYSFTQYVSEVKSWGTLGYKQIRFWTLY